MQNLITLMVLNYVALIYGIPGSFNLGARKTDFSQISQIVHEAPSATNDTEISYIVGKHTKI